MSRAHDRAYALLAERVRLGPAARLALSATIVALICSGVWWLGIHYANGIFAPEGDDLVRVAREALALRVHGAIAFAMLIALGAMGASHARRGWALARNRISGVAVVTIFALLIVSGYALYYLVSDETQPLVSLLHWLAGLALGPLLAAHILIGRSSRAPPHRPVDGSRGGR